MAARGKILLIDDEQLLFGAIELFLGDEFDLAYAGNGEQGVALAKSLSPDLILLDVGMPDIDGFEVCRRIKADPAIKDIPVIFLTAYGSVADEMAGLREGAIDYISKPFNEQIVKARVSAQLALKQQHDELRTLVRLDDLTKISNRRHFDEVLRIEWRRAYRYKSPLSVVIADIDSFKKYNDGYGHVAGDTCLRDVASLLKNSLCRSTDLLARFGGEEFIALLPNTPEISLHVVAERLRASIESAQIPHQYAPSHNVLTTSVGAAAIIPCAEDDPNELIVRADSALYRAKSSGGNQIFVDYSTENSSVACGSES